VAIVSKVVARLAAEMPDSANGAATAADLVSRDRGATAGVHGEAPRISRESGKCLVAVVAVSMLLPMMRLAGCLREVRKCLYRRGRGTDVTIRDLLCFDRDVGNMVEVIQ
jgi:hypothetical protein